LAHHSTKLKLWRLPRIKGYILKYIVPSLWPTYIGERRTTFAKAYGIKARCYGEHIGEYIENLMGTHCELKRNTVGTHWEPEKKSLSPFLAWAILFAERLYCYVYFYCSYMFNCYN
jgi:hypothetical protein